ncbi:helicase domain protein [Nitzschia inconspicua]|uniref:Helicase domain protein n=1 Tax=Nitzschia inconspicua TaxID=303405 RepID=A0A9K3LVM1_9STRA|nr:helicase domain protein [Nitzschia inconspicua]
MDASADLPNLGDMIDDAVTEVAEEAAESFLKEEEAGNGPQPQEPQDEKNVASEPRMDPVVTQEGGIPPLDISMFTKHPRKRVRRAGKRSVAKIAKFEQNQDTCVGSGGEEANVSLEGEEFANDVTPQTVAPVVSTKHDEKWNERFDRLLEYKAKYGNTLVPQYYQDDSRLGRWVHYQRVEYWIFQETGQAKITKERISRLNAIGFEWDPQKAIWELMFNKLKKFKEIVGHCRVPKGYNKDPELANWVRNQRLEEANLRKGKKSRMTPERYTKLTELGFVWSVPVPARSKAKKTNGKEKATAGAVEVVKVETAVTEETGVVREEAAPTEEAGVVKKEAAPTEETGIVKEEAAPTEETGVIKEETAPIEISGEAGAQNDADGEDLTHVEL